MSTCSPHTYALIRRAPFSIPIYDVYDNDYTYMEFEREIQEKYGPATDISNVDIYGCIALAMLLVKLSVIVD